MFSLTLRDHLRLTFSLVVQRHNAHRHAARSHARWNRWFRGSEAVLMGGVTLAALAAALDQGPVFAFLATALAGVALIILLLHLTFDFETTASAHALCSGHLWHVQERYRALLSDLHEGALDLVEVRRRRDMLMDELRAIYDQSPVTQAAEIQDSEAPPLPADDSELPGAKATVPALQAERRAAS
jgi:hypothetical protein